MESIDDEFCKTFDGGFCPYRQKFTPRSWCFARCDIRKVYPGIGKMVKAFVKESAKYIKGGRPKRSEEEVKHVKQICDSCTEFNKKTNRCYLCGCNMCVKIIWATTKCPIGKWE